MRRLSWLLQCAALGLLIGALVGMVDGLVAPPMAGESEAARLAGLVAVDGAMGLVVGLVPGLLLAFVRRPAGGPVPAILAGLFLVLGLGGLAMQGQSSAPVLLVEAARAGRLEAPLPSLTADDPAAVLIISLDTVRADALEHMPHLDARARSALRFDQARSTSSWTLPSMASLHTGQAYPAHGAAQIQDIDGVSVRTGLDPELPTLAEQLQEQGFVTLAATTNPLNGQRYGFHRGFDRYVDLSRRALRAHALRRATLLRPLLPAQPDRADAVVNQALAWLPQVDQGRFALWVHLLDAHAPYSASPDSFDPLGPCALPDCFDDWASVRRWSSSLDEAQRERVEALYHRDLAYLDAQLERLFAAWEEAGLLDRSLVVLTADHGEAFWQPTAGGGEEVEHGGSFREELVRVPLLVWAPGRTGQQRTTAVDLRAVAPAVLSWAQGQGLGPLDADQDMQTPLGSLLFAEGVEGCTDGRHKVLRRATPQGRRLQVFDLLSDPGELHPHDAGAPPELVRCIEQARSQAGRGLPGDVGALRALGYVDQP